MATARILASTYQLSNTSYLNISNAANMYTNVDSTTYAQVNHTRTQTTSYYVYIRGFNFSQIPSNATITSAIVKVKALESGASAYTPALYNNTTSLSKSFNGTISTSAVTRTVDITSNWNTYKGYGSNFGIRLQLNRSSKNKASYLRIYGAEITVEYTVPPTEQMYIKDGGAWKTVSAVYKKVNGTWVEQTDLKTVFDTNTNYVKG